jgi:predicted transcriptional regulator
VAEVTVRGFGDLEAAIMDRLWVRGTPTSVRELQEDLRTERDWAYNTVLTVVDNLFKKGWLQREPDGRAYRYIPVATRAEYGAQLMRGGLDEAGDPAEALTSFVGQMSPAETAALRAALAAHEKRRRP